MSLWAERLEGEWRLAWESHSDRTDTGVDVELPCPTTDLMAMDTAARFAVSGEGGTIYLSPKLADRPVVSQPERPFYLPAKEAVDVYIGTPLWLSIALEEGGRALEDLPILRPSDTWFGPDTRTGEICYASRTACRLRLADVQRKPHRALTRVTIRNEADHELFLERIKLPVQVLSLYQAEDSSMWTEDIELRHLQNEELAAVRVTDGAPRAVENKERLCPPRQVSVGNLVVRAFSTLFQ